MIQERIDPRYEAMFAFLEGSNQITTGVHGTEGQETYPDGPSIAEIAEAAEFGLGQPQRSWLRAWFDEAGPEIEAMIATQFATALAEGQSREWAAERVALWVQASIQKRIAAGISPPNAKQTILEKGSSTPLIDTGLFRSAVVSYADGQRV